MFTAMPEEPLGTREAAKLVFPSGSGVSNALGLAKLFAPFANGGGYHGVALFSEETIAAASEEQWHATDSMFGNEFLVALGLLLNIGFNDWGREGNIGTAGAGGYAAFTPLLREAYRVGRPNAVELLSHVLNFGTPRRLQDALAGMLARAPTPT